MTKVIKYLTTYVVWVADLVLALWLALLIRTAVTDLFILSYNGDVRMTNAFNFIDKAVLILLGLGWLIYMIVIEGHFRNNIDKEGHPQRLASVTGWTLVCVFVIDLILTWMQGIGSGTWLRWLTLAAELGIGLALLVIAKTRLTPKRN
jgi:hypothetical protein